MRLQLSVVVCVAGMSVASAQPADEPTASATLRVYADDDHVTVVSPSVLVRTPVTPAASVTIDATADAVSAASVDVTTSASPRAVEERRVELGLAVTWRPPVGLPVAATLGARGSHESDYDAVRARIGAQVELAQRNTILELSYVLGHDLAGSVVDDEFRATRTSHQLIATATQVLGRRTVADLIIDGALANGYHASPYREVAIAVPAWPLAMRVAERTPTRRASLAIAARVRRAFAKAWYGTASYRAYADDWSMVSHTASGELRRELGERWLVGALLRGYLQDGAAFHRGTYDGAAGIPTYRTRDRTLGPMRSAYLSTTADVALGEDERWHLVVALGVMQWWFLDSPAQAARRGVITHATLTRTF